MDIETNNISPLPIEETVFWSKRQVQEFLKEILERPDILINAVTVENSNWDADSLISEFGSEFHQFKEYEALLESSKTLEKEAKEFAEWCSRNYHHVENCGLVNNYSGLCHPIDVIYNGPYKDWKEQQK